MSPKFCPHCLKKVPIRKRFKRYCPHCFKPFRRRSGMPERNLLGQWLEDRTASFWFMLMILLLALAAIIMQLSGAPDLLNFIDHHTFWFVVGVGWAALYGTLISRIYFPLLWGAPKILRRERTVIRHYKIYTTVGLIIGVPFSILFTGLRDVWSRFPATSFLMFIPMTLMWSFQALTLTEEDYEDERVLSYMQELGAQDRLEHRHRALFVLIGLPLAALMFYYFMNHNGLARTLMESEESGLISMFRELWNRTRR